MLRIIVIMLVFFGAIFVLVSHPPEQVMARSEDGLVTIEGVSRTVRSVTIDSPEAFDVPLDQRVSAYYLLVPDLAGFQFFPVVQVSIQEAWISTIDDVNQLSVYVFMGADDGWIPVSTDVDTQTHRLRAHIQMTDPVWMAIGVK